MKTGEEINFRDVSGAVNYLVAKGYKISPSSFYLHRSEGKIRPQADGTYAVSAVRKYAKTFLRRRDSKVLLQEALARALARRATEIVCLVAGDPEKAETLKKYLFDLSEDLLAESYTEQEK